MEWVDIPSHRVLVVRRPDFRRFRLVREDGSPAGEGEIFHRAIRDDGRVFKCARFGPISTPQDWANADRMICFILEEI